MKHIEIECKWDANTPRAFGIAQKALTNLCGPIVPQTLHIKDIYLDDAKRNLAKQHIAMRVRRCNSKWQATFKTRTHIKNGKAVRQEENIALPGVKNFSQALLFLIHKRTWKKINTEHILPQFMLTNKRSIYTFIYKNSKLEMAFDKVTITVAGRRVYMQEIELELKQGSSKHLDQFAQQFTQQTKLKHTTFSKVKTAEMLLNLWKK